jgi:hypothetical protein
MSYLIAAPEFVSAAATDLARIGSAVSSANAAALAPTSGVLAAGADGFRRRSRGYSPPTRPGADIVGGSGGTGGLLLGADGTTG